MKRFITLALSMLACIAGFAGEPGSGQDGYIYVNGKWGHKDVGGVANGYFHVEYTRDDGARKMQWFTIESALVSELEFDCPNYESFCDTDGSVSVIHNGKWYILKDGALSSRPLPYGWVGNFVDGLAVAMAYEGQMRDIDLINTKGEVVYTGAITKIGKLINGRRLFYDLREFKYGYMDEKNAIVIPAIYLTASDFGTGPVGKSVATVNPGFGYADLHVIDRNGKKIEMPGRHYTGYTDWVNGFCVASVDNDARYLIDTKGNVLLTSEDCGHSITTITAHGEGVDFFYRATDDAGRKVVKDYCNGSEIRLQEISDFESGSSSSSAMFYDGYYSNYLNKFCNTGYMVRSLYFTNPYEEDKDVRYYVYYSGGVCQKVHRDIKYLKYYGEYAVVSLEGSERRYHLAKLPDTLLLRLMVTK